MINEKATKLLRLPRSTLDNIRQRAKEAGVSMNGFILECVAGELLRSGPVEDVFLQGYYTSISPGRRREDGV